MQDWSRSAIRRDFPEKPCRGFSALGAFLFFGAAMASLAGATLIWRGTFLDRIWILNPKAYRQLAPLGRTAGIFFLMLAAVLALAGVGWFRRRLWGWKMAVAIIAMQAVSDLVNLFRGDTLGGSLGAAIAGALLAYLWHPYIRAHFAKIPSGS